MRRDGSFDDPHALLEHDDFLRALARGLVIDEARAHDVVQQAWLAAIEKGPAQPASLRAWLATAVRRLAWKLRRGEDRRERHEQAAAKREAIPAVAEIVAREQARRRVVESVLELDEPNRTTLLLRYFERLPPRVIAQRLGIPVETVRTRIKRSLERMRARLDREHGGDRAAWAVALLPFAKAAPATALATALGSAAGIATFITGGVLVMSAKAKLALAAAAIAVGVAVTVLVIDGGPTGAAKRAEGLSNAAPLAAPATAEAAAAETARREPDSAAATPVVDPAVVARAARATGTVRVRAFWQSDHTPAVDVGVALTSWDAPHPQAFSREATTDAEGRCTFSEVAVGNVSIEGDRGGSSLSQVTRDATSEVELLIPPGMQIEGIVVDKGGAAVRDAEIWLSGGSSTLGCIVARTDAEGRFTVRAVTAPQVLGARAAGFAPSGLTSVAYSPRMKASVRFVLDRSGGAVRGRVVRRERGQPIAVAGAIIQLGDERRLTQVSTRGDMSPQPLLLRKRSDADGRFQFEGVMTGEVALLVRGVDCAPWRGGVEVKVGSCAEVEIELLTGATIEGRILKADGTPAGNSDVRLGATDSLAGSRCRVPAEGTFRFEHVSPGPFEIVAVNDTDGFARASLVATDGATLRWDAHLVVGPQLRGRVLDQEEHPVRGCTIQAMSFGDTTSDFTCRFAKTGDDGRFVIQNCDRRPYQVEVRPPEVGFTSTQFAQDVVPGGEELVIHVSHALPATAWITGIVTDSDGHPIGGANVLPFPRVDAAMVGMAYPSDAESGRFNAGPLAPGLYSVSVNKEGLPALQTADFELAADEKRDLGTIRLPRGGTLRATLVRDDDHPIGSLEVRAIMLANGLRLTCTLQDDVATASLAPGAYELRTIGGGCVPTRAKFEIVDGKETALEIALEPAPEIVLVLSGLDVVLKPVHSNTPYAFTRLVDAAGNALDEKSLPAFEERRAEWRVALSPGAYRIEVLAGKGVIGKAEFTIPASRAPEELEVVVR